MLHFITRTIVLFIIAQYVLQVNRGGRMLLLLLASLASIAAPPSSEFGRGPKLPSKRLKPERPSIAVLPLHRLVVVIEPLDFAFTLLHRALHFQLPVAPPCALLNLFRSCTKVLGPANLFTTISHIRIASLDFDSQTETSTKQQATHRFLIT